MSFNPDDFMAGTVTTALDTTYIPVPEGEYQASVSKIAVRTAPNKAGGPDYVFLDVQWKITDPEVAKATARDESQVRQSMFLDVNDAGQLDVSKGKNIDLGKLRDAVGQNTGKPWSPSMLEGAMATVIVSHRMYEDQPQAEIKKVRSS